ncbi:MAG: DUF1345 domain-containing protein [Mycetocola sp.]
MSHIDRKVLTSVLAGIVLALVSVVLDAAELAPLVGWVAAGTVFLSWAWGKAWNAGPEATRELALHEGRSRRLVDSLIIGTTFVSLLFVVFALLRSQHQDTIGVLAIVLAMIAVVVSWALINTVYAFKYARMYYHDDRHRFQFNQKEDPSYSDFACAAFSIGMAYNASNVDESSTASRRIALGHELLAYLFGTIVVAVAINLVTSLAKSG